ncbi:hypothetical protein RKE29_09200 [Streptomyces sp. B1866]|uniref:hypothetical protein n=1 Tax=Streptomyces sp. B1866 TaxID=3075431 RepID=UPI0028901010|nr:hypothetical protein [Streptomyces sp. B1866]MDT3396816.1 hypothetical protein [Streptomyces sp. B1866]
MGSLRNPIGPLPSSTYWRRRAVALTLLVLVLLLVVWLVNLGGSGGGGDKDEGKGQGPGGAATAITPGPTPSGPVDESRPGGRDEADGGGSGSGDDGGATGGGDGGAGGDSGGGAGGGDGGGTGGGSGGGAGGGRLGIGEGQSAPAAAGLPECQPGAVKLTVRSVKGAQAKQTYEPGENPSFRIVVTNSSASPCAVDFGHESASLTITDADGGRVWATEDCPKGVARVLVEVPGDGTAERTVTWDRKRSAEHCAAPAGGTAPGAGTYLVVVKLEELGTDRASFSLEED